jgi:hypothetical protein
MMWWNIITENWLNRKIVNSKWKTNEKIYKVFKNKFNDQLASKKAKLGCIIKWQNFISIQIKYWWFLSLNEY